MTSSHKKYMQAAIEEARKAPENGDVPVGAVIVYNDVIIGKGYNMVEQFKDATLHAEIIALKEAFKNIGGKYLHDCSIYVTLEPCAMCSGAIVLARVKNLIFGADDSKAGACGSLFSIPFEPRLNHRVEVIAGIMSIECSELVQSFFHGIRNRKIN